MAIKRSRFNRATAGLVCPIPGAVDLACTGDEREPTWKLCHTGSEAIQSGIPRCCRDRTATFIVKESPPRFHHSRISGESLTTVATFRKNVSDDAHANQRQHRASPNVRCADLGVVARMTPALFRACGQRSMTAVS